MKRSGLIDLLRRGHLRHVGIQMLAAAGALLAAGMLLLGVNVSTMRHNFAWVQQADDVLLQVSDLQTGIYGVELSVRGYALTDNPSFLVYLQNNQRNVMDSTNKLGVLVVKDPSQAVQYAQLRKTIAKHLNIFVGLSRLGPGHAHDVASAILDNENRNVMNAARAQLAHFRDDSLKSLADRQAEAAAQASKTYGIAMAIVVIAFLLGALGIVLSQYARGANAD
jgi:CHASE3 domain sensor protein